VSDQKLTGVPFRIRRGASIGEPDAESDERYLENCFVDSGYLEQLLDCDAPQRIIVGRTGSGKSALIAQIKKTQDHVLEIAPDDLSLNYLSNSTLLVSLAKMGVKLDLFYTLLWKHVFAVELLKVRFGLSTEEKTKTWMQGFVTRLHAKDQLKERALEYLRNWGDKFWSETEYRVKEVTQKLERDLQASLDASVLGIGSKVGAGERVSEERRLEFVNNAQRVVNNIQMKALSDLIRLLSDDVFNDPQKPFYIVIDRLDENWIDDDMRYRLIRALIETIKSFRVVRNVKIIIALRVDLLERVFDKTRDSGFQEEKYQSLFMQVRWSQQNMHDLLTSRLKYLVSEQYTKKSVSLDDLFPPQIDRMRFLDYLCVRTLYRPRDAIAFVNECLKLSEGKQKVSVQTIFDAERAYSAGRQSSLEFEWISQYPKLREYFGIFERMPSRFKLSQVQKDAIENFALKQVDDDHSTNDPVASAALNYINTGGNHHTVLVAIAKALYHVGVLGIKPDGFTKEMWNYHDGRPPTDGQIKPSSTVAIHPMLWIQLGIVFSN